MALTGVGTGNFQSDTLTIAAGDTNSPIISPSSNTGASILVHMRGCELIEFDWDLAGAQEGVSMNSLFKFMDQ